MDTPKKPAWGTLTLLLLVLLGLLGLTACAGLSPLMHRLALVGLTLLTYIILRLWIFANRDALLQQEWQQRTAEQPQPSEAAPSRTLPLTPVQQHYLEVTSAEHSRAAEM